MSRPPSAWWLVRIAATMLVVTCIGCTTEQTPTTQVKAAPIPASLDQVTAETASPVPVPTLAGKSDAGPAGTATALLPPDLTGKLAWFAPLPPMPTGPGREFTGSDDFMELFVEDSDWQVAAAHLDVFKLYGEWVAYHATPEELRIAVEGIRSRGLALAVEAGPLDATADCGQGIEGFAGSDEGRLIARRILDAGGRIDALALDEPYYYASIYDGPGACKWDAADVATEVGEYIDSMRGFFPDLVVGDTEPTPPPTTADTYTSWLETFRAVNGYDLGFLHLDIDWAREGWERQAQTIVEFGDSYGVPIGVIYTGNHADTTDENWLAIAGERVKDYEASAGTPPAHVIFQSWHDHPDRTLPETQRSTFTNMIRTYFEDRPSLGFTANQLARNLALGRPVQASAIEGGFGPEQAVDGDTGTHWSAGADAPQWIEITLDAPSNVPLIRLTPSQYPPGETSHRILALVDGTWVELGTLTGPTSDGRAISLTPETPLEAVQAIRIETDASPSWVAWYEIEVIGPNG